MVDDFTPMPLHTICCSLSQTKDILENNSTSKPISRTLENKYWANSHFEYVEMFGDFLSNRLKSLLDFFCNCFLFFGGSDFWICSFGFLFWLPYMIPKSILNHMPVAQF